MKHYINFLSQLKNGQQAKLLYIIIKGPVPQSVLNTLNLLYSKGFIRGYQHNIIKNRKFSKTFLKVFLKYDHQGNPAIKNIKIISKSSRHVYLSVKNLWKYNSSLITFILQTSKGLMTDTEARLHNIGGFLLFSIF